MYTTQYDIDNYLNQCEGMSLADIILETNKELARLNQLKPPRDICLKEKFTTYKNFLSDFLGFLGGCPVTILPEYQRERIKPVIRHFVDTGQLPRSVLDSLE